MVDGDLPACPCAKLRRDLDERLLVLEALLGRPMSIADLAIAAQLMKQRYEQRFLRPVSQQRA